MRLKAIGKLLCGTAALGVIASPACASVILSGSSYSENFDGRIADATSVSGAFSATIGVQAPIPAGSLGTSGWDGVKKAGTGTTPMNFTVDAGGGNSGALYSYGSTATGITPFDIERALGSVASGTNTGAYGVEIVNNTGATITAFKVDYVGEYWRSSTSSTNTPNTITFGYQVGAAGSTGYLTSGTALLFPTLDLIGPPTVAANGPLDGDLPANQVAKTGLLTLLNWGVGQSLYLRFSDVDDQGSDAGLAVDNFVGTVVTIPEPATCTLIGLAGLALIGVARRRS